MRRPLAMMSALLAGISLTVSSGCYHMYSQPYGYSSGVPAGATYPGTMQYGAPIQTLTPGQPYTPGGTYQAYPQGTNPTYQGGGLQPIPESNAPTYQNNPPTSPNTNNPTTPDPYFPNTYNAPTGMNSVQPTAYAEPTPLNPPTAALREVRSVPVQSAPTDYVPQFSRMNSAAPASAMPAQSIVAPVPASGMTSQAENQSLHTNSVAEDFALPVMSPPPGAATMPATQAPGSAPFAASPFASSPEIPDRSAIPEVAPAAAQSLWDVETNKIVTADYSAFGHDEKFQWLRGVISKEPRDGTWSIVYNDRPSNTDKWAGHLSLAPSPKLENLRDGDIVEIQGELDDVVHDQLGKPVYVVSSVKKPLGTAR